jgi:hypothetical protein
MSNGITKATLDFLMVIKLGKLIEDWWPMTFHGTDGHKAIAF